MDMEDFGRHIGKHFRACYQLIIGFILLLQLLFVAYLTARWLIDAKEYVDRYWFD